MRELYELYIKCFPEYPVNCELFNELLCPDKARLFCEYADGGLVGFAMAHGNSVSMLCVDENYRRRGIGTALLDHAEDHIAAQQYSNIILGQGKHYLLQGVPADAYDHVAFFEKRGYSAAWTSVNMTLPLDDFDISGLDIPECSEDVSFRFVDLHDPADMNALRAAVADAEPHWLGVYEKCSDPVFAAVRADGIVGFQILAPEGGRFSLQGDTVGSIGCVGVIHSERNHGIGRRMVAGGAEWLKEQGCSAIELRYVELVSWYEKLGFKVNRHQWMGEKQII